MSFQATIPSISNIITSPTSIAINDSFTISATVTEIVATLEYTYPYSGTVYSGQEVWPWP